MYYDSPAVPEAAAGVYYDSPAVPEAAAGVYYDSPVEYDSDVNQLLSNNVVSKDSDIVEEENLQSKKEKSNPRAYFPETWLWNIKSV